MKFMYNRIVVIPSELLVEGCKTVFSTAAAPCNILSTKVEL